MRWEGCKSGWNGRGGCGGQVEKWKSCKSIHDVVKRMSVVKRVVLV